MRIILTISAETPGFRGSPQWVMRLLIVALLGAFGCTPAAIPSLAHRAIVAHEAPASADAEFSPLEASLDFAGVSIPVLTQGEIIREETLAAPVSKIPTDGSKKLPAKLPRPDDSARIASVPTGDDAGALQNTPGPRADERLLNLLEIDLDKAVETPRERRRLEFSKQVSNDPKVRYFIDYFSSKRGKPYFEKILARSGKYMPMIARVLNEEGLPEELAYLALIESAFLTGATSSQGAAGLWQFVPSTARLYGLKINSWVDERRDPEKSTRAAAAYLKELHSFFGRWYLATAAYNAGQGAIDRAMQQSGAKDFWTLTRKAQLSDETRNFVPKFVAVAMIATNPEKYGFTNLEYESPLEYEEVEIRRSLRIGALAEMADTEVSTIRELNPALLANTTPPGNDGFTLKIPVGKTAVFAKAYEAVNEKATDLAHSVTHEVKKGETLASIARRYGQEVGALMRFNGLTSARLYVGQQLKILIQNLSGKLK
ncbi:MAG TPA: transglycosylase SLT domain-containing protein [Candidatus Binatia bacterium]|nr:transglycosylase SLT domain-containing protein [Candidatus Binatia bacterium]